MTREALTESEDIDGLERISSIVELLRQVDSVDVKAAARLRLMAAAKRSGITLAILEAHDGVELIARVRPWCITEAEAVQWFLTERLASFGQLTPAEIIKQYGDRGFNELLVYIKAKEAGGFE